MDRKSQYRAFCRQEKSIPIFSQPWWLDATAGTENWDVFLIEKNGRIVASLPYVRSIKHGLLRLGQPLLTQKLGPWLERDDLVEAKRLSREKDLLTELYEGLPKYLSYDQCWDWKFTNWLPLYWMGYQQTTKYTYRLENLKDEGDLWKGLQGNIRSDIKKAENRFGVKVRMDGSLDEFYTVLEKTYLRQGIAAPHSLSTLSKIESACAENSCRKIFLACDEEGQIHAGAFLVWDDESAYYIMGGGDPDLRKSGATSLCLWKAILFSASVTESFDFEGSMLQPVERFFRAFGAKQVPYSSISRRLGRWEAFKQKYL